MPLPIPGIVLVFLVTADDNDNTVPVRLVSRVLGPARAGADWPARCRVSAPVGALSACCKWVRGYGRLQDWLELPVQAQIWDWVPEPPQPVSSRHLPELGLTYAPLDW